jgi:hypothetical protein
VHDFHATCCICSASITSADLQIPRSPLSPHGCPRQVVKGIVT